MKIVTLTAFAAALLTSAALAEDPLEGAYYDEHLSGPTLEPRALEGKVVLLEYFGDR